MKATVYKAPQQLPSREGHRPRVFLGGSIEMGKAVDWQTDLTERLSHLDIDIFNPRRDDWDSSWVQDPTRGTKFHEQVEWEMRGQETATHKVYYFADNTMSPITLLELGLYSMDDMFMSEAFVYSTPAYLRHGNVKMVCDRYKIPHYSNYEDLVAALLKSIRT